MEDTTHETRELKACINNLVSMLALPAIWSGRDPSHIVTTLLDGLLGMLRLDFAYLRLNDSVRTGAPIEMLQVPQSQASAFQREAVGQALNAWFSAESRSSRLVIPNAAGGRKVSIASRSLGLQEPLGVLVVGSGRANFPTQTEMLLLDVASNQAVIGFHEAQRLIEQKRIAEELDRRVAERTRELAEREAKIRRLVDANIVGIFIWNLDGRIIEANDAFLRIVGYEREDLASAHIGWRDLTPQERLDRDERAEAEVKATGAVQPYEKEYLRKDGSRVQVLVGAALFETGGNEGVAFVLDLTQRKRAQEALKRSERYLAETQRLTHTGSFIWDVRTRQALYLSDEWYRIFGFDPKADQPGTAEDRDSQGMVPRMLKAHAWEERLQRIHPEDRSKWEEAVGRAITEKSDYDLQFRILLPDRTTKYVHAIGHPVLNNSGEVVQFVGSATDVTDRKQAEEEREKLRQLEADLAHVNRVSMMGELAASLAHELKQPLAAVGVNAKTCMRWLQRETPEVKEACDAASRMVNDASRAADIIDRLRSLYRRDTPPRELLDFNEIIREMSVMLHDTANRNSVSIRTELDAGLPMITADRVQLQQVMMNLILNGIEAMKDSGGELTVKSHLRNDGQLLICVSDTGVGLPPEKADQIFNAFFTTKPQGSGMGLSISWRIIEFHGGRLWASANPGRGATFQFTLPIAVTTSKSSAA